MAIKISSICTCFFVLAVTIFRIADALTCACDDCQNAYQCEVDDGGVCYSKVTLLNGKVSRQKHCYTAEFVSDHYDYLCGLQSSTVAVECCSNEDYCNLELSPELLQEDEGNEATPSTDSMQPDTTDGNELNPNEPHGEDQGDNNGEIVLEVLPLTCYKSNPVKSDLVSTCTTNTGSCFHVMRKLNGAVVSERYGCSENCVEEDRNRAVRTCCNTTLCNSPTEEETTTTKQLLQSSTKISIIPTQASNPTISLVLIPTKTSNPTISLTSRWLVDVSSPSTRVSAIQKVPSSSTHQSKDCPSATATPNSSSTVIPSSSSYSSFLPSITPSTFPSSSSSLSSSSLTYVLGSVCLGLLYLLVLGALCLLIFIVCYNWKRKRTSPKEKNIKKSTDTLMSISV